MSLLAPPTSHASTLIDSLLEVYPFGFCVATDNTISALGRYVRRHHPSLLARRASEVFALAKARDDVDLEGLLGRLRSTAEPSERTELIFDQSADNKSTAAKRRTMRLAGSLLPCGEAGSVLFLGTVAPSELRNMTALGLSVGDFGPIDPSPEFAMMAEVNAGMLADSQLLNRQLRQSRDEAVAARKDLEAHRARLEETVRERTAVIERQAAELNAALHHERYLSEMQRGFVSMASHEFRTPLAIIDGYARIVEKRAAKLTAEMIAERTQVIRAAVKRMTALMETTLAAASMEAGKIEIAPKSINLRLILQECCAMQRELTTRHRIVLDDAGLPDQVHADPSSVTQIATNLLSNAVKYSPEADRIDIRGWQEGDCFLIAVQDYGLGIDEGELDHMFTRFFRARSSVGIPGTGIGLNLSLMLAKEHGGTISVASRIGEGSTFTLRMPVTAARDDPAPLPLKGGILDCAS